MEFSKQEYWSGWPFPSPGGFPDPGIEPRSPALQADSLPSEPPGKPNMCLMYVHILNKFLCVCIHTHTHTHTHTHNFSVGSSFKIASHTKLFIPKLDTKK